MKKRVKDLKAEISSIKIYFKLRRILKWKNWEIKQELERQALPTEYKWQKENLTDWRYNRRNSHFSKKKLNLKHDIKHSKNMGSHNQNQVENASHRGQRQSKGKGTENIYN